MRKAISTFIAAVILVAFTISAAIIVTSFLTGVIKFQTTSVSTQAVCAQKGALLIDTAMCTRVRDNSLVGYWKFDSVNSTNYTADSSGYGNDGRLFNGTANCFNATGCINLTAGQIGNALQFDGVNDYVNTSLNFNTSKPFSVSVWVLLNDLAGVNGIIDDRVGGNAFAFGGSSNVIRFIAWNSSGGGGIIASTGIISSNIWYFAVAVYNQTHYSVYLDGNFKSSVDFNTTYGLIGDIDNVIRIGTDSLNNDRYFNGTMDEVRIYNRSLSADEINQHYQKGVEKFAVDGYFKTIKASVRNIGSTPLSNFTIFADINGRFYQNDTPQNGGLTLPAASEPLTLQAYTYYDGPIRTLKVSVLNCPISMTLTNDSAAVGTC